MPNFVNPTPFPRTSENGSVVDYGDRVPSTLNDVCPNCSSSLFVVTTSTEHCSACGLHFDYWGGRGNDVYREMTSRWAASNPQQGGEA